MTDNVEILTKVYGFVNRGKVCLTFNDIPGAWKVLNELSDYLVSVDCAQTPRALDSLKDGGKKPEFVIFDDIHDAGK